MIHLVKLLTLILLSCLSCKKIEKEEVRSVPPSSVSINTGDLQEGQGSILQELYMKIKKYDELNANSELTSKLDVWIVGTSNLVKEVFNLSVQYCVKKKKESPCESQFMEISSLSSEEVDGVTGLKGTADIPINKEDLGEDSQVDIVVTYCDKACVRAELIYKKNDSTLEADNLSKQSANIVE